MSFPGNGANKPSKVRPSGVRPESQPFTTSVSGRPGHRDGMGRDGKGREDYHRATRRSAELMARAVQWAKVNLPDESRNRAVAAFLAERGRLKRDPSTTEVLTRLKAWGHDRESWIARFGLESLNAERAWLEARGL